MTQPTAKSNLVATVSVKVLMAAVTFLQSMGEDWGGVGEEVGLSVEDLSDPERFVGLEQSLRFCELASLKVQDDGFGVRAGAATKIGDGRLFDYFVLSAPTVKQALDNWVRFQATRTNAVDIALKVAGGRAFLYLGIADIFGPRAQFLSMVMAFAATRINHMLAAEKPALIVQFAHVEPYNLAAYHEVFGPNVSFGQPMDRIGFAERYLSAALPSAEPNLFSILEEAATHKLLEQRYPNDDLIRISKHLGNMLKHGNVSLETVSRDLGMSKRSLQRTLEDCDTSFRELVDEVRRELAERYLLETNVPISEIPYLLGYSDLSVFSRSAKGWFGLSPRGYRRQFQKQHGQAS